MPHSHELRDHRRLRLFGALLHRPDLWHLNRRSVAGAVAAGGFLAWVPLPLQMVMAAAAAIVFNVNLPIAVAVVWITNPITMPPMFWFAYKVGAWILHHPARDIDFELSLHWLTTRLIDIWQPFLLGCLVMGIITAGIGLVAVRLLWRIHVIHSWHERKRRRMGRLSGGTPS